jgi:hypothetical protein
MLKMILNNLSAHYLGLLCIGTHHACVYLQEYNTIFMQPTGHIAVNSFEKCWQVVFRIIILNLRKSIISFLK